MPSALESLRALRQISLSQFVSEIKNTNYCNDVDKFLLNFCEEKAHLQEVRKPTFDIFRDTVESRKERATDLSMIRNVPFDVLSTKLSEYYARNVFHLSGSTTNAVMKRVCENCISFLAKKFASQRIYNQHEILFEPIKLRWIEGTLQRSTRFDHALRVLL